MSATALTGAIGSVAVFDSEQAARASTASDTTRLEYLLFTVLLLS
jgi:hypothetical protein